MAYCQDQRLLLQGYDSIWGLYWIRRFYNDSDGNNYQQVGQDIIQSALTQWLRPTNTYPGLPPNATTGEKLRSECPIISAESQGQTSQLIQGMRFLLDELRPGFDTDDYDSALARWQARPNASKGQIAAARLYPEAFKTVIHALLTGEGEGWLTRFANHPLRRETLQWGVYCNGNHHDLALCVPTNATQVIRQGNKELRVRPFQGRLIVPLGSMLRAGIDASAPCFIGNDPLPPLNLYSPLIARVRRNTPFTPFIESRANLQIQATALWTATPVDQKGDFLLGNQFPVIDNPRDIPNYGRLCKLALGHIDRTQPQPLTFNNQWLVNIGAAPELAVTDPDPWIQSLQEPQTHFVFANQASLTLSDLDTNQNAWSFSPGATLEWVNGQPILHSNTNYGRRLAVSVDVGLNYPLRVVIRFLPTEMRQAMINEQAWERDGVSWTPLCPSDKEFQLAITQAGLIRGTLTVGDGTPVWVWFPSMKPHFWFRHGFNPPTQVDRYDYFSELDELREQYLHVYIPPGRHPIRWGGEDYLECEGPGYWEEPLNDLDRQWPERDSDDLEIVHPNGQTTRIATVMDRPQGSTVSVPEFEEGGFEQYLQTEFHLAELARHLDWMIVDGTPWPTSWSVRRRLKLPPDDN
jgi:hypothetical protein